MSSTPTITIDPLLEVRKGLLRSYGFRKVLMPDDEGAEREHFYELKISAPYAKGISIEVMETTITVWQNIDRGVGKETMLLQCKYTGARLTKIVDAMRKLSSL